MSIIATKLMSASNRAYQSGSYVATSGPGTGADLVVFDHRSPDALTELWSYGSIVSGEDVTFSPDGKWIVATDSPDVLIFRNNPGGTLAPFNTYTIFSGLLTAEFSPNQQYLLTANDASGLRLRVFSDGSLSSPSFPASLIDAHPQTARFHPDGSYFVVAANAESVGGVVEARGGVFLFSFNYSNPGATSQVAYYDTLNAADASFSPDGNYVAAASGDFLYLLDHTTPGSLSLSDTYDAGIGVRRAVFSPDGDYIVLAAGNSVVVLDHTTPGSISLVEEIDLAVGVFDVEFSPDGKYLVAAHAQTSGTNYTLTMYGFSSGVTGVLDQKTGTGRSVSFSPT